MASFAFNSNPAIASHQRDFISKHAKLLGIYKFIAEAPLPTAAKRKENSDTLIVYNLTNLFDITKLSTNGRALYRKFADETRTDALVEDCAVLHNMIIASLKRICNKDRFTELENVPIFPNPGQFAAVRAYNMATEETTSAFDLARTYLATTMSTMGRLINQQPHVLIEDITNRKFSESLRYPTDASYLPGISDDDEIKNNWFARNLVPVNDNDFIADNQDMANVYGAILKVKNVLGFFDSYFSPTMGDKATIWQRVDILLFYLAFTMVFTLSYLHCTNLRMQQIFEKYRDDSQFSMFRGLLKTTCFTLPTEKQLEGLHRYYTNESSQYVYEFSFYTGIFTIKQNRPYRIRIGTNEDDTPSYYQVGETHLLEVVDTPADLEKPGIILGNGMSATLYNIDPNGRYALRISLWTIGLASELKILEILQENGLADHVPRVYNTGPKFSAVSMTDGISYRCVFAVVELLQHTLKTLIDNTKNPTKDTKPSDKIFKTDMMNIRDLLMKFSERGFMHHDMKPDNIMRSVRRHPVTKEFGVVWYIIDLGGIYWTGKDVDHPIYPYGHSYATETTIPLDDIYDGWTRILLTGYVKYWDMFCLGAYLEYMMNRWLAHKSVTETSVIMKELMLFKQFVIDLPLTRGKIIKDPKLTYELPPNVRGIYQVDWWDSEVSIINTSPDA